MKFNKKFNFTDIILIVVLLAVVCGFAFRAPIEKLIENTFMKTEVNYVIETEADTLLNFEIGKDIYDINGVSLGTVSKIDFSFEKMMTHGRVTLSATGIKDNSGVYIGEKMFIAPGVNISFKLDTGLSGSGTVKIVKTESLK